ncbi:MAG: 3-oxoacyl-ACP synthase, partial [Acidimicrobiia bacterium]
MTAAEIAELSGIPENVLVERFGLRGKHIAAADEHVSDMSVTVATELLVEAEVAASSIDAVVYFGSTWMDYQVWQAAPWIAHRLGARNAFALELDYMSCGSPVAVRVVRDMMQAEPELRRVLAVAACRESYLLDYTNERARFMFNFGDGAVAALFEADTKHNEVLGAHMISDGSFSLDVKVPAGGSIE